MSPQTMAAEVYDELVPVRARTLREGLSPGQDVSVGGTPDLPGLRGDVLHDPGTLRGRKWPFHPAARLRAEHDRLAPTVGSPLQQPAGDLDAAPEVTPKKDAFNVLYGTIPILWANREGSWRKDREVFLRSYRNTCKLHEAVAAAEMTSHEFVTPDRAVQRTRFSDGTEVVVNFGPQPYSAEVGGKRYELPQNGFAAKGPRIEQSRALVEGRVVTTIRTPKYEHSETK